jgi:hypothetical protein
MISRSEGTAECSATGEANCAAAERNPWKVRVMKRCRRGDGVFEIPSPGRGERTKQVRVHGIHLSAAADIPGSRAGRLTTRYRRNCATS